MVGDQDGGAPLIHGIPQAELDQELERQPLRLGVLGERQARPGGHPAAGQRDAERLRQVDRPAADLTDVAVPGSLLAVEATGRPRVAVRVVLRPRTPEADLAALLLAVALQHGGGEPRYQLRVDCARKNLLIHILKTATGPPSPGWPRAPPPLLGYWVTLRRSRRPHPGLPRS